MKNIVFTDTVGVFEEFYPKTSTALIPDWYRNLDSYMNHNKKRPRGDGKTNGTIKRCMPVFDALTAGYILVTYVDVFVSQKQEITSENGILSTKHPWYEWPSFNPIDFHPIEQAPNHPNNTGHKSLYPKWVNPWAIKTPPGYSTLFVQPFHRESIFTIFPGVVDTDTYSAAVNLPFVLNDPFFEGLIPAGTPMAQVIPFKRESWKMSIGTEKEFEEQRKISQKTSVKIFDAYKSQFRQVKTFR